MTKSISQKITISNLEGNSLATAERIHTGGTRLTHAVLVAALCLPVIGFILDRLSRMAQVFGVGDRNITGSFDLRKYFDS